MEITVPEAVKIMEDRFKVVTSLVGDLSSYPISRADHLDFETDREKSREFAEVFTPVYMVDQMLGTIEGLNTTTRNLDLCAGHGQFTIRMLRKFMNEDSSFDLRKYLMQRHFFNEIQPESCWKLLWTFGSNINLAIGSALKLNKLPENWKGVWVFIEGIDAWVNITETVKALKPYTGLKKLSHYPVDAEEQFVRVIGIIKQKFNSVAEGYMDELKQILSTPNGRRHFLKECGDAASGIEENWQDKMTPEWVCKEMVDCIPGGVTGLKKILVLFNAEFLEVLVKQKKVNPRNIDFAFDSKIEGLFASKVYRVNTLSVGKNFQDMVAALEGKSGKYDIVISNPPYQISDGGYGKSAMPIYHKIVEHVIDHLNPQYICMITPSRWMVGGKGLNDYRARMLSDKRIKMIQDFPGTNDVFSSVDITGGVSYFLWDKGHNDLCEFNGVPRDLDEFDILVRDNTSVSILKKVLKKHKGPFCDSKVLSRKPFGLPTNFKDWVDEGTEGAVKCYVPKKDGFEKWTASDAFTDEHNVRNKWKVFTPRAGWLGNAFKGGATPVISQIFFGEKGSICLETYIVAGSFDTRKEATNFVAYMKTRFYRFMLSLRLVSQDINKQKFAWVPDFEDYTVEYTDQDLYEYFGLTKREIDHIEKTIKPLN